MRVVSSPVDADADEGREDVHRWALRGPQIVDADDSQPAATLGHQDFAVRCWAQAGSTAARAT